MTLVMGLISPHTIYGIAPIDIAITPSVTLRIVCERTLLSIVLLCALICAYLNSVPYSHVAKASMWKTRLATRPPLAL